MLVFWLVFVSDFIPLKDDSCSNFRSGMGKFLSGQDVQSQAVCAALYEVFYCTPHFRGFASPLLFLLTAPLSKV